MDYVLKILHSVSFHIHSVACSRATVCDEMICHQRLVFLSILSWSRSRSCNQKCKIQQSSENGILILLTTLLLMIK